MEHDLGDLGGGLFRLRNVASVGYLYYLNCYMFRSYDHLQAEIYLLVFTQLTMDPLFLEYSEHYGSL
jgi:hypothetical protein